MPQGRALPPLSISALEREALERWASGRDRRLARRAALVIGLAAGEDTKGLARRFRLSEPTVDKWRSRFQASRLDGLLDAARPGAPRRILAEDVERVISHLRQPPPPGVTRWTTRSLARICGVSQTTVSRIWRAHGVDPRSGALPDALAGTGDGGAGSQAAASQVRPERLPSAEPDLARLARDLNELKNQASPQQAPYIRMAVEALEAALAAPHRVRGRHMQVDPRVDRARLAVARARELVKGAQDQLAALRASQTGLLKHIKDG